jgi:hypothetical protein
LILAGAEVSLQSFGEENSPSEVSIPPWRAPFIQNNPGKGVFNSSFTLWPSKPNTKFHQNRTKNGLVDKADDVRTFAVVRFHLAYLYTKTIRYRVFISSFFMHFGHLNQTQRKFIKKPVK